MARYLALRIRIADWSDRNEASYAGGSRGGGLFSSTYWVNPPSSVWDLPEVASDPEMSLATIRSRGFRWTPRRMPRSTGSSSIEMRAQVKTIAVQAVVHQVPQMSSSSPLYEIPMTLSEIAPPAAFADTPADTVKIASSDQSMKRMLAGASVARVPSFPPPPLPPKPPGLLARRLMAMKLANREAMVAEEEEEEEVLSAQPLPTTTTATLALVRLAGGSPTSPSTDAEFGDTADPECVFAESPTPKFTHPFF
jgi:hypothetical protein